MKLYIIRHGETDWNKERRMQGSADIELNEYGRKLAFITKEALKDIPFDIAYTSPLKRASETAKIILEGRDIPLYKDKRIEEMNFGKYEGKSEAELIAVKDDFMNCFNCPEKYYPKDGAETHKEVIGRAKEFLEQVVLPAEKKYEHMVAFSHGAWIHGMLTYLYQREIKDFWHGPRQQNCGVTTIQISNGDCKVLKESEVFYK